MVYHHFPDFTLVYTMVRRRLPHFQTQHDTATSTMETELPLPLIPANGFSWNRTCKPIFAASRFMTSARHKEQEQPAQMRHDLFPLLRHVPRRSFPISM